MEPKDAVLRVFHNVLRSLVLETLREQVSVNDMSTEASFAIMDAIQSYNSELKKMGEGH